MSSTPCIVSVVCVSVVVVLCCVAVVVATTVTKGSKFQQLDVHLKLSPEILKYVEGELSDEILKLAPHNDISFKKTIPHITLYLTEYVSANISDVVKTMDSLVPILAKKIGNCRVDFGKPFAQGSYYMWNTEVPSCLQEITDNITNALAKYRNVNQEVPEWVYNLPEPGRSERIKFVHEYGSPNVFKYFSPHLTLAWSDKDDLTKLDQLHYPTFSFEVDGIGLGVVSDHGTVLRDKDVAHWNFK